MVSRTGNKIAFCAFFLAAFSCALGLFFCMVKSPQAKSSSYMAAAVEASSLNRSEDAAAAALAAVRLDPANQQNWRVLSQMLRASGRAEAALQAHKIALRLQHGPAAISPVYAMPAEFRLSQLAEGERQIP